MYKSLYKSQSLTWRLWWTGASFLMILDKYSNNGIFWGSSNTELNLHHMPFCLDNFGLWFFLLEFGPLSLAVLTLMAGI